MKHGFRIYLFLALSVLLVATSPVAPVISYFKKLPIGTFEQIHLSPAAGGATNENYFLSTKHQQLFVRHGSDATTIEKEALVTQMAAEIGLAPPIISYDRKRRVLATKRIENMQAVNLKNEQHRREVCATMKVLHRSEERFPETMSPPELVKWELKQAADHAISPPGGFLDRLAALLNAYEPVRYVPCHLDLHYGNMIHDGERLWIIDWETAKNSDPLFDLAILASTEGLSTAEMAHLLMVYDPFAGKEMLSRLFYLRALADARWAVWCLTHGSYSSIDYPYLEWAEAFMRSFDHYAASIGTN